MPFDSGDGRRRQVTAAEKGGERCPRCESRDTKFCYYNNYNTAQPRHFCRACRRYWTLGGALRNVPIGGSTRKRPRHPIVGLKPAAAARGGAPPVEFPRPFGSVGGLGSWISGPQGISSLGDLGLGLGLGCGPNGPGSGPMIEEELGFGLGPGIVWPPVLVGTEEGVGGAGDTWRMRGGGNECFAVPSIAAAWSGTGDGQGGSQGE